LTISAARHGGQARPLNGKETMESINWHSCFFLWFALVACVAAVAVAASGNIVRMACYLIVALGAVAGLFFLAGADFLGAVQLMVYVGGTMVLLVFGVMLTARGPLVSIKTGGGQWIMAIVIGGALLAVLLQAALSIPDWAGKKGDSPPLPERPGGCFAQRGTVPLFSGGTEVAPTAAPLGLGLMGVRVDRLAQPRPALRAGMSGHLLAFELISIHLVVVLVGAAYLARARRRVDSRQMQVGATAMARLLDDLMKGPLE
jgi:NADH-quinone oxidoreductase subunit J